MVENTVSPSSIAMSHKVMMTLHASGCKIQKIFQHINKRNALQQTSYNSSSNGTYCTFSLWVNPR